MDVWKHFSLERKIVLKLWGINHALVRISDGRGGRRRVLVMLREHDGMPQNELTRKLGVQPGTVSEVLGRMEEAGLIVREVSKTDRRTTDVYLTEKGNACAEEAAAQRETQHKELFQSLSEEEKKTLYSLLDKIVRDLNRRHPAE